ncbi:ABC transporter ATP-binding protein [Rhodobacteraceae bacterium B1Z28]|uniref:ABC transporter ATP-binding protein n=1 Tax=Ruegeria haliotis TaxID=2747601 RepID=A0ABX2PRW1_9RHOB|nr:ABC transporter ATP-binding protein [Ruegeria haliotis]NVO56136.1 ABC transporter ATP-binding protein [Ruegeria haliotis]
MSIAHLLEDFTVQVGGGAVHLLDEEALEEQRLAAFEQGYGAGWDDAVQAQQQSRGQVSAELSKSLEDMSFTYHEAITRMILSLEPMFQSLSQAVLPDVIERGFAACLVEQLCDMAREQIEQPMQIMVPEGRSEDVESLIPSDLSPAPRLIEDPSLGPGQARLQVGMSRREVDCSALLTSVARAFDSYVFEAREALSNE